MRIHPFLFLVMVGLVILGSSPELQCNMREAEKSHYVGQKEEMREKSPLPIKKQDVNTPAQTKSSKKVEISYQGLSKVAVKTEKRMVPSVVQNASPRVARKTLESANTGGESQHKFLSPDPNSLQRPSQETGKSPATFTNQGVISFKGTKKHLIRSSSSQEGQRK